MANFCFLSNPNLHKYEKAHDRFVIIDEEVYHIGASLKDLGKKLFAFPKMEVLTGSQLLASMLRGNDNYDNMLLVK